MSQSLFPADDRLGLLTDLYELTMAAGYFAQGMADQPATFELWIRRLPSCRNFLIAAGLEQVVHYLENLSFSKEQIDYLRSLPVFERVPPPWFERLARFSFTGDLWAVPEGTAVFAGEPILRLSAPLDQAQIVETFLIAAITFQTMVASKAVRSVQAARGKGVVDFGTRRAHGPQAGLLAARASFLGGCAGTSNTEAARLLGIPAVGTQAHAWVMAFASEVEAFRKFGEVFPASTLLVDTYETLGGIRRALESGAPFSGVRLDSGDLLELSRGARRMLDEAGRREVQIVASGDLNEYKIQALLAAGAPIDVFGVGTEMVTSRDEPTLSTVYKLVELATPAGPAGRMKLSAQKRTYPFAKQVFRQTGPDGRFEEDVIGLAAETLAGEPLLRPVMKGGRAVGSLPSLAAARTHCQAQLHMLPPVLLGLGPADRPYPVSISPSLDQASARLVPRGTVA